MKKVAVLQSNYIPWKGYFDIINGCDEFIFLDDVQYTKNDWRNRNKIKSSAGTEWLTIPIGASKGRLICEVTPASPVWARKHYSTLSQNYAKAPFFSQYREFLEHVYLERQWTNLSELNQFLIRYISTEFLGIDTNFKDSREFSLSGRKLDRLLDLLKKAGAEYYISGPAAKEYIDDQTFADAGIKLVYQDYSGYPEYKQIFPPFDHYVTVFDLLFHVGPDAPRYHRGWREEETRD
ncbi:MAG: WbqC family protein [Desulfuromonadales bacterium]|nr:WbqC family protein [Desulfuromonadales bacterium]